jgi:hypothetical protein
MRPETGRKIRAYGRERVNKHSNIDEQEETA